MKAQRTGPVSAGEEVNSPVTPYFNLVDEPWIPVLNGDGSATSVSLKGAFDTAETVRRIQGELPTMRPALLRILIAVMVRALGLPAGPHDWERKSGDWSAVTSTVHAYLDDHHNRFWLHHPETPFFQVPDLGPSSGGIKHLGAVVADFPANVQAFTQRGPASLERMSPAEAARWIVHAHAYDPSGIKTPDRRDPRASGGKVYPLGTGWAGKGEIVMARADTLADTLRLNYVGADGQTIISRVDDLPPWERAHPGPLAEFEEPAEPQGFIQVYTWQTRRLRLIFDGTDVVAIVLCYGDPLSEQNRRPFDPMMTWRYSQSQSTKFEKSVYMPGIVNPGKAVWRSLSAWLPTRAQFTRGDHPRSSEPGVLQWIGELSKHGALPEAFMPDIELFGVEYGTMSATYAEVVNDSLRVPRFLLEDDAVDAAQTVILAIDDAEKAAWHVGNLATNLAKARGIDASGTVRDEARDAAYLRFGQYFVTWLLGMQSSSEWHLVREEWQQTIGRSARDIADGLAREAGIESHFGRLVDHETDRWLTTDIALGYFHHGLRKSLPLAYEETTNAGP